MRKVLNDIECSNRVELIIGKIRFSKGPGRMVSPKTSRALVHRILRNLYTSDLPSSLLHFDQEKPETRPHIQELSVSSILFKQTGRRWKTGFIIFSHDSIETLLPGDIVGRNDEENPP